MFSLLKIVLFWLFFVVFRTFYVTEMKKMSNFQISKKINRKWNLWNFYAMKKNNFWVYLISQTFFNCEIWQFWAWFFDFNKYLWKLLLLFNLHEIMIYFFLSTTMPATRGRTFEYVRKNIKRNNAAPHLAQAARLRWHHRGTEKLLVCSSHYI